MPLTTQRVFPNLSFTMPVGMFQAPGDASRWFVIEQGGVIKVFNNQQNVTTATNFIDLTGRVTSGGERGLLGMAFHPNFPTNPHVYLSYTATDSVLGLVSRISEFSTSNGGLTLTPGSERILMTVAQPFVNHKGGHISFGPDGFLYIGFGDGGSKNDPNNNAQTLTTVLGKVLRIDVNSSTGTFGYGIPTSNPYRGNPLCGADGTGAASCPEIYAYGLRNPWRWSFDRQSGALWVADVGEAQFEEVNRIVLGGNYGWRCFEGAPASANVCSPAAQSPLPPIAQYGRTIGRSVTGGFVYRGSSFTALIGRYVFADFISGRIFNIPASTDPTLNVTDGFDSGLSISSFGQDVNGELYVIDYNGGLYRIAP